MNFLITGITGFAGPHLAELLIKNNHTVYGLIMCSNGRENDIRDVLSDEVYNSIKWVYSDLRNLRSLSNVFKDNEFDGVFHLAAQSHPPSSFIDPVGTMETNVMGRKFIHVLDQQPNCNLMFVQLQKFMEIQVKMDAR